MKKRNYIGEISDIFQVPPSTLRYWENECLIKFSRDEENNYRLPSFQTILDIWDIIFYRDLSIPLKEIKLIPSMNIDELGSTLTKNKEKLIDEFYKLKKTIEKIESKEKIIEKFKYLQSTPCYTENRILSAIKIFDYPKNYLNKEMIQLYISHPNEGLIVIDSEKSIIDYGIFVSETDNNIFREKDCCEKLYLRGLLKAEADNIYNNNSSELILHAEKLGYKTGIIIGQYLISTCEDKKYDYYETWVELF